MKKILCAMSGGVDSTAAALILKDRGLEVTGVTLLLSGNESDAGDAKKVAGSIGIEHIALDLRKEFDKIVKQDFCNVYLSGGTPNPCIVCNKKIKFGMLLDYALEHGFDGIATGHYADKTTVNGHTLICRAADEKKDQSYMLWQLSEYQVERTLFPLSDLSKQEIREHLADRGIVNHDRPDSQDVCFIPDGDYVNFISEFTGIIPSEGKFLDTNGKVIGKHLGSIRYTIGQRKGLGMGFGEPVYVLSKDSSENTVVLGKNSDLFKTSITVKDAYINAAFSGITEFDVKIRYAHKPCRAEIIPLESDRYEIIFSSPQRAPAKGQSAVFYMGDALAGGGFIE